MSSRECQAAQGKKGKAMAGKNHTEPRGLPELGVRLKAARNRAGIKQRDVELALDTTNVSRWESGSHRMYVNDLLRLALLYGIDSLDEVLGPISGLVPEAERPQLPTADDVPLTRGELRALIAELSDDARAEALEVMDRRARTPARELPESRVKGRSGER